MSARRMFPLRVESLEQRLALSGNLPELVAPVEVLTSSLEVGEYQSSSSGTINGGGGIEPINPLPPVGGNVGNLPPEPTLSVNAAREAAILKALQDDLTATNNAIQRLNPNDPNYQQKLAALQLRAALDTQAIGETQAIAANVANFAGLAAQADALASVIAPMLANPPTTVDGWNLLLGLLSQYTAICGQMQNIVDATAALISARADILAVLGL